MSAHAVDIAAEGPKNHDPDSHLRDVEKDIGHCSVRTSEWFDMEIEWHDMIEDPQEIVFHQVLVLEAEEVVEGENADRAPDGSRRQRCMGFAELGNCLGGLA